MHQARLPNFLYQEEILSVLKSWRLRLERHRSALA